MNFYSHIIDAFLPYTARATALRTAIKSKLFPSIFFPSGGYAHDTLWGSSTSPRLRLSIIPKALSLEWFSASVLWQYLDSVKCMVGHRSNTHFRDILPTLKSYPCIQRKGNKTIMYTGDQLVRNVVYIYNMNNAHINSQSDHIHI